MNFVKESSQQMHTFMQIIYYLHYGSIFKSGIGLFTEYFQFISDFSW